MFDQIQTQGPRSGLSIPTHKVPVGLRRGWRPYAVEVSAIPDPLYPYDPAVVEAIRNEFDPGIIPLIVRRVYRADTGELRTARFHAIATHRWTDEHMTEPPEPWTFRVMLPLLYEGPYGDDFRRPNRMAMHIEDRTSRLGDGLPGGYLPFDWRVYHLFRVQYQEMTAQQKMAYQKEAEERRLRVPAADDHARQSWKENPNMVNRMKRITPKDQEIAAEIDARRRGPQPTIGPWRKR